MTNAIYQVKINNWHVGYIFWNWQSDIGAYTGTQFLKGRGYGYGPVHEVHCAIHTAVNYACAHKNAVRLDLRLGIRHRIFCVQANCTGLLCGAFSCICYGRTGTVLSIWTTGSGQSCSRCRKWRGRWGVTKTVVEQIQLGKLAGLSIGRSAIAY